jgi:hypothetical protein
MPQIKPNSAATPLSVASGSENCSSSMPAPYEFFDHTSNKTPYESGSTSSNSACGVETKIVETKIEDMRAAELVDYEAKRANYTRTSLTRNQPNRPIPSSTRNSRATLYQSLALILNHLV